MFNVPFYSRALKEDRCHWNPASIPTPVNWSGDCAATASYTVGLIDSSRINIPSNSRPTFTERMWLGRWAACGLGIVNQNMGMVWYSKVYRPTQHNIGYSKTIFLQARWPIQQCQSTEGGWLVFKHRPQSHQAQIQENTNGPTWKIHGGLPLNHHGPHCITSWQHSIVDAGM